MSQQNFCTQCGNKVSAGDRFCHGCGYDLTIDEPRQEEALPIRNYQPAQPPMGVPIRTNTNSHSRGLIMTICVVLVLFLVSGGGGLYWWLSSSNRLKGIPKISEISQNINKAIPGPKVPGEPMTPMVPIEPVAPVIPQAPKTDLTMAHTYLSKNGLKCTFAVNYADGDSALVSRISGLGLPEESIIISEIEIIKVDGEEFGYGMHYIEKEDGTYYMTDGFYDGLFPVLKNDLAVGRTWEYSDEFGRVIWTVVDIGVELDLGFHRFEDCLLVKEDNQAVGYESMTYYAPGYGIIYVTAPGGASDYYKMTSMTSIDEAEAEGVVMKWSSN